MGHENGKNFPTLTIIAKFSGTRVYMGYTITGIIVSRLTAGDIFEGSNYYG